jgi:cytosine/adenosine deaminase-related metal-dependent hydrolase
VPASSLLFRARFVLPISSAPIDGGWVRVRDGRIVEVGAGRPIETHEDLGDVALLPGLVNAHTHLELSFLEGRVPPASAMPAWIQSMIRERLAPRDETAAGAAIERAIASMMASGTVLVGDITNSLAAVGPLRAAGMAGVIFHELTGFAPADPVGQVAAAWKRVDEANPTSSENCCANSVVAHAPYSVAPELFRAIAGARGREPLTVHTGESPEEIAFLRSGGGPFKELIEQIGKWNPDWTAPGCGPIEYLDRCGYLQPGMLAVHGGHLSIDDLARLRGAGGVIVTCPRSNVWVGAGVPDVAEFYRLGLPVAIGTDSLASVDSLNMFDELAAVRRAAPSIAPSKILESATLTGAVALGRGAEFGSLETGKRAELVAVPTASVAADDVEEYLVSGQPHSHLRVVRPR